MASWDGKVETLLFREAANIRIYRTEEVKMISSLGGSKKEYVVALLYVSPFCSCLSLC